MFRFLWVSLGVLCLGGAVRAEILPPGHRPPPAGVHALIGAKVITKPGEVIENGVIILRDGLIEAVGKELAPPADARVWELPGRVIYAGFIDPHLASGAVAAPAPAANDTAANTETLTAGGGFDFFGVAGQERDPGGAGPGSPLATITPERRVAATYTPDAKLVETMRELGFTAANIAPGKGVLRGSGALVLLADANPNRLILQPDVFQHIAFTPSGGDAFPNSLMGVIAAVRQSFFDAGHYRDDHTHYRDHPAGRSRPSFNPALAALAPALAKTQRVEFEPGGVVMVDRAARVARELGLDFCILASGQEWRRPDLAKATAAPFIVPLSYPELPKLPEEADWQAVSLDQLRAWDWAPENAALLRQQGLEVALTTHGLDDRKNFRRNLRLAMDRGLSEADALAALTTVPARLCGVDQQLGTIEAGKIANLTVVQGSSYFDPEAKVREVWVDGRVYLPKPDALAATNTSATTNKTAKASAAVEARKKLTARSPLAGRGSFTNPPAVLVRGATIWTSGTAGRLTNADLLVVDGRVKAIGAGIGARDADAARALVIDGQGKHVTPGIIDAHSHSMIVGSVNEGTLPSTAMVRVADVVNSETANIHQQLAGGVTVANQLHGSANPIGGQNAVIKLRDGASPEELKLAGAPEGIKFALGENVKQSNWGENKTTRFPQTRMGVPTFMANRFLAARQYLQAWAAFKQSGGAPPRRDLELEALGEIIAGQRLIHCHSYRQDEIVAFLRVMEEFGVKVATLQHVLEGYKVADEIAQHGAGGSTFADWWGYKFEVYDAIAHNASLMRDRGVVVSINSDSDDHARRLYLEAAKAVKFGGAAEAEALKMVTLNPARQLRIDQRVGSLEPGKDGDFVLWSASPLSTTTVCLQTWIDGKKYFDRDLNAARVAAVAQERKELLEKARLDGGKGEGKGSEAARAAFFRRALEQARDHQTAQCLDCDGGRETP